MVKKCSYQRTICLRARSPSHSTLNPEEMPALAANATNRLPVLFGFADGITDVSKPTQDGLVRGLEDRASRDAWECGGSLRSRDAREIDGWGPSSRRRCWSHSCWIIRRNLAGLRRDP